MKECISPTIRSQMKHHEPLVCSIDMGGGKSSVSSSKELAPTLCTTHGGEPATYAQNGFGQYQGSQVASTVVGDHNNRVTSSNSAFVKHSLVRRITPLEAERLMGFPDNWTKIPWRGKSADECPDSLRYKACGNSMCVNVMRWIGMRIEMVERKVK